ncbi:MAG: alanine racemase [Gammaproteobacteria bacterium]|jgi:alanine racemase
MDCPTKVHIDVDALQHNFNRAHELAPDSKVLAMVKANAYGHGITEIAKALHNADAFGVACLAEASSIRQVNLSNPIVLMSGFVNVNDLTKIVELKCEVVIHNFEQIKILEQARLSHPVKVWLKINTGMHRLGFVPEDVEDAYVRLSNCKNVAMSPKLMTHFADADDIKKSTTAKQIEVFNSVTKNLSGEKSLANSAAILSFPESHADWVRPGGLLYGVSSLLNKTGEDHNLMPVMTLKSKIITLRFAKKDEAIGYGGIWRCPENMPFAIVGIGYGDGYPRHAKNGTPVLVNGHICPLIGRVAMDMLAVDVRSYPCAKIGDEVILWGKGLPIEHVAAYADTITYELFCGVTRRGCSV